MELNAQSDYIDPAQGESADYRRAYALSGKARVVAYGDSQLLRRLARLFGKKIGKGRARARDKFIAHIERLVTVSYAYSADIRSALEFFVDACHVVPPVYNPRQSAQISFFIFS